jgi:hypothetical protein
MRKSTKPAAVLQKDYERLRQKLAHIGYISHGSVVDRSKLRPARFGYQWTCKVKGKTITMALSNQEFEALGKAIANERKLCKISEKWSKSPGGSSSATGPNAVAVNL